MEVERFWCRRLSLYSLGFFLNRYLSLVGHIPIMMEFFSSSLSESVSTLIVPAALSRSFV